MSAHTRTLLAHLHRLAAPAASDAVLLTRWIEQRDQAAFAALMARHGPMVFGVCRRLLGDEQEAEEVFQAAFLVLSRQAANLREPEALAGFLHTVAVRLARKTQRAKRRRQQMQTITETPEPIDPRPHPLDVLSGRELLALLDAEIARLPASYRLPLLLCLLQGRTVEEAARQLGWTVGSLRGRLARGRERLRQRLTRRGLDLSVGAVALLAPVVVPEKLLAEALRHLSGSVPVAISALAGGMMQALKLKILGLVLVVVTAVGVGAGLSLRGTPEPQTPAAPSPAAPPRAQTKDEPRRDRYGDPLPPGAVARLGTLRFRAPGEIRSLVFAPDSKTLVVSSRGGMYLFDALSGKRLRRIPSASPEWRPNDLLVISSDGKQLIGRGYKTTGSSEVPVVRVWELASGRQTHEYDIGLWLLWVGWSPEGQPLAIRVEDKEGALQLHDLAAGRSRRFACAKPYKNPVGAISREPPITCSPRGHALAVADAENVIHLWDTG
ncbi:MAG: sigma-70 family RNA polymerase sigma factor, partial [Gemmataceae bacterium]